ncbi:MAG TPA: glycosyltransferase 87 family protein [Micromonospora sp.]
MRPAPPPTRRRSSATPGFVAVTLLATLACVVAYRYSSHHDFFDLKIYVRALRWWAAGNPLYDYVQPDRVQGALYFTYPPFAALLLRPFTPLPLGVTAALFTVVTLVAVVVTTWWLVTPLARARGVSRWWLAAACVPLVLLIEPLRETITFGQINMLLVVLVLADLLRAVPRGSRWAGVGVGLATAIKLFPGIFLVYLLLSRRWRAAVTGGATAAAATVVAAAVAPRDSWRFWTDALWATERVGRTDYTGNQSLLGLVSRLVAPQPPQRLLWVVVAAAVAAYGLWRAMRAARAGDEVAGLALTGLVGALVSPITWTHHVYWFVPALVVVVDAALTATNRHRRGGLLAFGALVYAALAYGVVSFYDWGAAAVPTDSVGEFVARNAYVLLALATLVVLPIRLPRQETFAEKLPYARET